MKSKSRGKRRLRNIATFCSKSAVSSVVRRRPYRGSRLNRRPPTEI